MDRRPGDFWQERILPQRRALSVRAKLRWTLGIMVILALVPVAGSIITVRRAEREISVLLSDAIDPARERFRALRAVLEATPPGPERELARRHAWEALLDLDDALIVTLGTGGGADSLLQSVNETEGRLEDLSRNLYFEALGRLRAERQMVARDLSLAVRDLILVVAVVLAVALFTALTAPRWVLLPVRRLSALLHMARAGQIPDRGLAIGDDEIGELTKYLYEHLRRDEESEQLRRRFHRANVQRIETLAAAGGWVVAAISTRDEITFAGRRMRELLGLKDTAPVPVIEGWGDPALIQALAEMRQGNGTGQDVQLTQSPFEGVRARMVLGRAGDAAEAEVVVLVPHDAEAETPAS